jgi:CBS domain-containing protein
VSLGMIQSSHGSYLMPSIEHATVADAMHPGILSCDRDAVSTEVARMMASHHVHCIAVTAPSHDERAEPLVWGIISDLDLIGASLGSGSEPTAAALAQQPVISVKPSTPMLDAAQLMLTYRAAHLVVVDPDSQRPIGILSTLDVAGILAWGEG